MTVVVVLLAIAVGVLTVIVFGLLRTHADILRALDRAGIELDDLDLDVGGDLAGGDGAGAARAGSRVGPIPVAPPHPVGSVADVVGTVPGGGWAKVAIGGTGHSTLLAFLSSGCGSCQAFWETFADPALELPGTDTRLVIVGQDPTHDSESRLAELAPPGVRTICSSAAWQDYDVPGSPYFVLVDGPDSRIVGSGSATSWDQVSGLLATALGDAGLVTGSAPVRRHGSGPDRTDEALRAAGIGPGHPSLWPDAGQPPT